MIEERDGEPNESILDLPRLTALRRGLTVEFTYKDSGTSKICEKYFGQNSGVSVSKAVYEILKGAIPASQDRLTIRTITLGLCLAAKCWREISNDKRDFCFLYSLPSELIAPTEYLFRCITKLEQGSKSLAVTILLPSEK